MIQNSRKLLPFRKRIVSLLTEQFGYEYVDKRERPKRQKEFNPLRDGPRVDALMLLADMDRINLGEAHYRTDFPCGEMETLTWHDTPRDERIERYFDLLYYGWEFKILPGEGGYQYKREGEDQYGTVQFVDWINPRNNSFTVYEGWRGVLNDGVAWDLIIALNHIPVVGVMMAPTTPGHKPCEEAYNEMRRQLDADRELTTYLLFCIISDGETVLVGSPDDLAKWFLPWDAPVSAARKAAEELGSADPRMLPIYALLRPEALCEYLSDYVRLSVLDDRLVRFCAHSHQYYAVQSAFHHLSHSTGAGYAILPESDDQLKPSPYDGPNETMRQLMLENYSIRSFDMDDASDPDSRFKFVTEPQFSTKQPDGQCVYRPSKPLSSPLA